MQSVGQKKTKTFRESSNATITRVLNTNGAYYKINLNRESEIASRIIRKSNPESGLDFLMIR